jgi:hypothetical protein
MQTIMIQKNNYLRLAENLWPVFIRDNSEFVAKLLFSESFGSGNQTIRPFRRSDGVKMV